MSLRQKYLKVLADIIPVGATSLSLLIGSTALSDANPQRSESQEQPNKASVSERLAAIRGAVSDIIASDATQEPESRAPQVHFAAKSGGSGPPQSRWSNYSRPFYNWKTWGNWFHNY